MSDFAQRPEREEHMVQTEKEKMLAGELYTANAPEI
jgi:hypothetical protein